MSDDRDVGSVRTRLLEEGREKKPPAERPHVPATVYQPGKGFTGRCNCGWRGPGRHRHSQAEADAEAHQRGEDV
jgi:hypothetical protein